MRCFCRTGEGPPHSLHGALGGWGVQAMGGGAPGMMLGGMGMGMTPPGMMQPVNISLNQSGVDFKCSYSNPLKPLNPLNRLMAGLCRRTIGSRNPLVSLTTTKQSCCY
jgi:hypothetical protein